LKSFVLDASLALEWFTTGAQPSALAKRSLFEDHVAIVPHLWRFEVTNVLTTWRRRGDITDAESAVIMRDLMKLPFATVDEGDPEMIVAAALTHGLSAYDATYLRIAMLTGSPIATLDKALMKAATEMGITLA
jgi:predicted nucleic acid-binding protein